MDLFGIRTRHGARLLTLAAGASVSDDECGLTVERTLTLSARLIVGDFGKGVLFCTHDADLATMLVETGKGPAVGPQVTLRAPFAMTLADLEVVNLATGRPLAEALPEPAVAEPPACDVVPFRQGLAAAA